MRKPVLPAFVLFAALAGVTLTGCSAPADNADDTSNSSATESSQTEETQDDAAAEQSVAEACGVVNDAMSGLQTQLSDAMSGMSEGDTAAAFEALSAFETQLGTAAEEVTNPEVEAAVTGFQEKVAAFNGVIANIGDGGQEALAANAEQLQTAAADMQTSATEIQELCS